MKITYTNDLTLTFDFGHTTVRYEADTINDKYKNSVAYSFLEVTKDIVHRNKIEDPELVNLLQSLVWGIRYKDQITEEYINYVFVTKEKAEDYLFEAGFVFDDGVYVGEDESTCILYQIKLI